MPIVELKYMAIANDHRFLFADSCGLTDVHDEPIVGMLEMTADGRVKFGCRNIGTKSIDLLAQYSSAFLAYPLLE